MIKRMLYITAFPPNHQSGGQTFSYNALSDLTKKYRIDLIYFTYQDHLYEPIDGITLLKAEQPSFKGCLQLPWLHPVFSRRFSFSVLRYLRSIAADYDVVYFDFIQVAAYSLFLNHHNKVIRCHDILAQKYKRENSKLFFWVKNSEKAVLKSANRIFTPSSKDSEIVQQIHGLSSTYTHEYLTPFTVASDTVCNGRFLLFGLWSRYENLNGLVWFVENIVKPHQNEFRNQIVVMGGGLSHENYDRYLKPYHIQYLGYVADSHSEIVKYKGMIAPLFDGAGVKVKVLDSFNTGTPVIGTDIAFEGIQDLDGLTYRANTPEQFLHFMKIISILDANHKKTLQKNFLDYYDNRHLSELL